MLDNPVPIKKEFSVDFTQYNKPSLMLSRYKDLNRITNTDNVTYQETPYKIQIKESTRDVFYSVEPGYENRMDLISFKFYNTPFLWWAIASINNIENPMIVPSGIVLRIPDLSSINGTVM